MQGTKFSRFPVATFKLTATIRNKAFNYKETVKSLALSKGQRLKDDIHPCNFKNSKFCDQDQCHIITWNLKKQNLRKLFTSGPNFREPQSLHYSRYKKQIDWSIKEFCWKP